MAKVIGRHISIWNRFSLRVLLSISLIFALSIPVPAADTAPVAASTASPTRITAIAAGEEISAAVNSLGQLYTWGYNWNGQLGDGFDGWGRIKPKPGHILNDVVKVESGAGHTLSLNKGGTLFVHGNGWDGQAGTGAAGLGSSHRKPTAIMTGVIDMSAGAAHSLVITKDHALYVFGRNRQGQLGNGDTTSQTRPIRTIADNVYSVSAGDRHSLAILGDQSLMAWGENLSGQLGTGDQKQQLRPIKVMDGVYKAYAGRENSFVIMGDNSLWGWGKGVATLLSATADPDALQLQPLKIMEDVQDVSLGASHMLILKTDGSLYVAGENWLNQLGLHNILSSPTPRLLSTGITAIAAGGWHSLAIDSNGELLSWGDNTYGQLGNLSTENASVPTRISVSNPKPSLFFIGEKSSAWAKVQPKMAYDRVVLPLMSAFEAQGIKVKLFSDMLLEFEYQDETYQHLIGSNIFYSQGKKVEFPLSTQRYQGEIVFLAYDTVALFEFAVHWDPAAQLLTLEENDPI